MPVVTSTRIESRPQADGRIAVRELHVADGGERSERSYLAPVTADLDAMLTEGASLFLASLSRIPEPPPPGPVVLLGDGPPNANLTDQFYFDQTTGNLYRRTA